jgi:hypothetical protein
MPKSVKMKTKRSIFFARFFRVNLVVCFDSILPKYTSALLFSGINPPSERHRKLLLDAEVYWFPWAEKAIATLPDWIICIRKSNKILIKILLTVSCVVAVFLNAKIYVFVWYKMAFHFLIFNLEQIGWPLRNIHNPYQYLKWQWIFYFLLTCFFPLSLPRFFTGLDGIPVYE